MYHRSTPPSPQRRLDGEEPPSPTGSGNGGRPRHLPVHEPYTQPPCVRRGMQVLSSRQYDLHIHSARDEQERVQKKVFMNWINNFLSQRTPPLRVDDVIEDLRDGTKLLALLECLSGQVLPRERARILRRPHFLSNVNTVLRFLEHRRIKLVNINATDVVDGKPAIVLGLIWTIILHFQIEEHTRLLAGSPASFEDSSLESTVHQEQLAAVPVSPRRPTAAERWKGGARKALLHWVKNSISQRFGVQVNDFGPSWRDGMAFLAIVHCIKPSLVDLDSVKKMDPRGRLERAFSLADRELGIPRLLDPEDVDVAQPDERSVMTYVAQFLHKYPGTYATEQPLSPTVSSPTSAAPAQDDLSVLESFLKRAESTLQILQKPLTNLREEYQSYLNLCRDLDAHRELYARLGRRAARADSNVVLSQAWPLMDSRWRAVESGLAQWRKRLDAGLPGRLAQVAEWLTQTEERLRNDKLALGQMDAATVNSKLAEHQSILSDLDEVKRWLAEQKSSPAIVATVAPEHLADIEQRLEALSSLVCKRQLLLEMERRKLALLALVKSVEQHVAQLEQKHGSRTQVEDLLRRHRDLLERDQVFQQFDRLFRELQEALDMCQRGSALGFQEVDDQARFLSDIHDHWTKLSARLRTSGNVLSEVVVQWQKYDALYGPMVQWLDQAEIVLQSTPLQKQEFFQDLPNWNEKKKNVVESGDYLAATCRDDIASTIRAQVQAIKQRWDSLYPQMHPFLSSGESLRATQQFQTGLDNLKHWLAQADQLLTAHVPCDVPSLEQHAEDLKRFQSTMEEQRSQYKALSRTAQVLVRDLSRTEVDKMMADMKKEKENQVRTEARCSQRLCTVTQVTSLVRALDADLDRLDRWLDKAEEAISTYAVPNTQALVLDQLEKHRAFFSQLGPMKALLASKNKTHRELREEVGACPGLDTSRVDARMAQLNERFQNCASLAEQWERALQEAANRWENVYDAEAKALDWLSKAEVHVSDRRDPEAARAFFSKPYEHILLRVIQTSKDVLATLPPEDHPAIEARVQHIKEKWKAVQQKLPRLNDDELFSELHESFGRNLETLNKELDEEKKLIDKGGNFRVILTRHEEYFNKSREMGTLQDCLEEMQQLAQSCPSHQAPLSDCQNRFRVLHERITTTHRLLQVPKDDWVDYSKKFNGLLSWMDQVDQRIEQLMQSDTSSASAYETQRTEFLDICETVDARRGDLDWLSQRLEALVPGMEPEEAKKEKERLAGLVARYGALLPVMETTTVVSETVSKCYLYREEVTQVTRWLREVRETKVLPEEIPLDSPEKLEQMVQKQKEVVEELEKRQGSVLESIKSGKDLQSEKGAPEFVSSDVKKLEEEWSQVYHEAVEKLDRMTKDSQRWQEFEKLRQEILRLLAQAEQELVNIGLLADMEQKKLEQCIKEKQEAAKKLQESMDSMLSRLRTLADELSAQLGPQREDVLRAELEKTERKTTTILTTVHETVHRLETAASKGTDLSDRLSRLSQWLDTAQDKLTAATEGPVPVPEQLEEVQDLSKEIEAKREVLELLEKETQELQGQRPELAELATSLQSQLKELDQEGKEVKQELSDRQIRIEVLRERTVHERKELDETEANLDQGLPTPDSLDQLAAKRAQLEKLYELTKKKIDALYDLAAEAGSDEPDLQRTLAEIMERWKQIKNLLEAWLESLNNTGDKWKVIVTRVEEVVTWVTEKERQMEEPLKGTTPPEMEKQKEALRHLANEVTQKQQTLSELQSNIEQLGPGLSHTALASLHAQVSELRKRANDLATAVRQLVSQLTSQLSEREELMRRVELCQAVLNQLRQEAEEASDINMGQLEGQLRKVQITKEELVSKKTEIETLGKTLSELSETLPPEPSEQLLKSLESLKATLEELCKLLDKREELLQDVVKFQSWQKDFIEQVRLVHQNVEAQRAKVDNLEETAKELRNLNEQLKKKIPEATSTDKLATEVQITFRDSSTNNVTSIRGQTDKLQGHLDKVGKVLQKKQEEVTQLENKWDNFNKKLEDTKVFVTTTTEKLHSLRPKSATPEGLAVMVEEVEQLQKKLKDQQGVQEATQQLGRSLIEADASCFPKVQEPLGSLASDWENLTSEATRAQKLLTSTQTLWKECQQLEHKLDDTMDKVEKTLAEVEAAPAEDGKALTEQTEKLGTQQEEVRKQQPTFDSYQQKTQELIEKTEAIESLAPAGEQLKESLHKREDRWRRGAELLQAMLRDLDSQYTIWKQVETTREEILAWLEDICECMRGALDHLSQGEQGRAVLDRYETELETQQQLFANLQSQLESLDMQQALDSARSSIQCGFEEAQDLADRLRSMLSQVEEQEADVKDEMDKFSDWLRQQKEALSRCDNTTGSDDVLLQRLEECRKLENALNSNDGLTRIEEKMARLIRTQPDLEVRHLQREQDKLKARLEAAKNQAARASAALLSILDRHHQGTLAELQHWLSTANDKLAWCSGGADGATQGDRFGLEARLVTLQELESTLEQGEKRKEQYCNAVNLLSQACSPERVPSLQEECSRICSEWTTFTSTLTQTREALRRSLDQWQHFETLFESLSDWLRDAEARAKSEAASQVDLPLLKDQISILKSLLKEVHGQKSSMQELEATVASVTAHVPDTQVPNQVSQLAARLLHLEATLQGALAQLEQLEQTQKAFEQAKQDLRDWLSQMEASLDGCKDVPGDQKALEAHLKRLQELQKQKGAGQALLNAVVDNGEAMYLSLSVESRDQVRKETRGLRDAWDSAWDKHTALVKGLESSLMAWSGFQDSCGRVASWLADMNTLIGTDVELKPNLAEKQLQLQNIRALSQDVISHQAVVSKLQTKSQELKETSMAGQVDGLVSDYEALCTRTKANIAQCEKRVSEHEAYQHSLERFLDWVSTLKATVDGPEEQGDMEAVKAKMAAYTLVLESEPEACAKLEHLRNALGSRVLPGTCPSGHAALQEQFANAKAQWEALLDTCDEGHTQARETLERWEEANKTLDELEQWLTTQRARCQDIPLQPTAETKRQQLDTLKKVEQDVIAKEGDFSALSKNAQAVPADTVLAPHLDKLRSKYHLLRNTVKEAVTKWEKLAKQHEAFDALLAELEEWLKQPEKELDEIVDAKVDLASTQDQKNKLENLSDRLAQRSSSMDELVESGERLYSHTAPDGRETIRQQLRHVKGRWQNLVERSSEALAELDQRLQQLSGLSQSQDQLRQWIEDVKTALDSCSQPRATLQEKKAQLQTHKVVHQDILSHQPAIDSMCERAQNLSATAGKDTLGDHVQSTKAAYQELCTRSQGLTGQLTSAVEEHQKLVDKVVAFQDWIQSFQDQLQEHKDTTGEKKAIQGRLEQLTELTEKSKEGEVLLSQVREQSQVVSACSSPQGQGLLSRELQGLQELLGKTLTSLQEARRNLENTLQQWGAYESHLASLTQWLSDTEAELRIPQMPATLADKEALSARGKELRSKIAEKQKSVDSFIDEAHCLLQLSGVELVRAQMSQCNARYQSLVATIKDLAARWEGMEKDQREYEKAMASCNAWLKEAEQSLSQIQSDSTTPEEKLTRLETLIVGKVHGQQQLNLASRLGEHLYQDTAATGRDQVRLELRELHERWESLESKIADLQKQLQLQSHARSSFVDSLGQVQMWLDNAEKTVAEARDKLPALQEAQGRLHSLKLLQQEAVLQRRQLDSLEEASRGDASSKESLEATSTRLSIVTEELKTLLASLEKLSALAQEQRERKEQLAAWLEQMHERLDLCRDVTGSRPVLKARLDKLQELEKQHPEGVCKAQALAECTASLVTLLTSRERASLEQESGTLEGAVARLGTEVEQARHALSAQLRLWDAYEEHYERLLGWLQGAEQTVQQFALQATLDEKNQQLDKFQSLLSELHATERDFDSLSDKAQELMVSSGEMRLSMAVSQLTARFQSLLETCKELVKKCEQHVQDHSQLEKKHAECAKTLAQAQETFVEIQALPSGNKERLAHKLARVKELLQGKSEALNLVNATVQLADQVQVGSSPEGWKAIQGLLQQLQSAYEATFDKAQNLERVLQSSQFLWSEYHEALQRLQAWLKGLAAKAEGASRLCTTLEEKKAHLRTCRGLLSELNEREQAIEDIQVKAEAITDRDSESQDMLEAVVKGHKEQTEKLQEAVKFLEDAVVQHEQLSKHLGNVRDWLSTTQEQAVALSNLGLDQLALYSNLERLKAIEVSFDTQDEELKRAEKQLPIVLQSTLPAGHNVVVGELDALKQQWQVVRDMVTRARESLEQLLSKWEEHHIQVEKLQQWMSERDAELQGLLLCDTLEAKRSRLEKLQDTLRELRAKELEVDSLTERAQQLHGGHSTRRSSRLADLALRYQQLLVGLGEAVTKWTQYVNNHQTLDKQMADAQQMIKQANEKLDQCELTDGSLSQLESKLAIIQEVSHSKDALVALVQSATEQCQTVLGETAPVGHGPLSRALQSLTEAKLALLQRLSGLRATLDHARQLWGGLSTLTKQVLAAVEGIEASLEDAGKLQETLAEKKAHAERCKVLEQRLLQEQAQVDNLKSRATELAKSHPGNEHSQPAFDAVERFKDTCKRAEKLVETTEKAYRNHLDFKNACDDLVSWLRQLREKVPPFTRSLSDRLSLESSISVLEDLLAKRAEGNLKLDAVTSAAETTKASTSEPGMALLDNQVSALQGDLTSLFDEISSTKEKLGTTCSQLREFREEYEHMSEWLQLMEDDIKNQRTLLWPTLEEKKKAFETAQGLVEELEKGHETLDRVTLLAQGLLTSHLDTYIRNQLTLVSSRYQVTLNLAKDLLGRARDTYNQHEQYRAAAVAAREWMDSMAASLAECSGPTAGKSEVEAQLAKVQGMVRKQDEGHALLHSALTAGEKTLRGTHASGKAPLNQEMQELQKQWDRLVLKLSDAKVSLETALLQWTDYSSSEQRLLQWIEDHDNQLEEVKKKRQSASVKESVTQRKARLRRANSLVKDVESFEPMVESLAVKAQELQQTSAAPKPEISGKYSTLAGSVKEYLRHQKSVMGHLQEFMDACANLSSWLEQAQEKLNKCAEPSGDRNELRSKHGTLKVLEAEQAEGQKRLQLMLALAETARGFLEDEQEQQHVDQESRQLVKAVEEFEKRMAQVKSALDVGLVKWDEYEEQFRRCQDWLNQHEPQVRSFQQLQPDLESKRVKLEEFQVLLQTVFEWQSEFDTLNLKAQLLLETYSDSSICNQFTQLSARYTSLLSLAKEVLHALEQHYQEHQQQQCMYGEVSELLDSSHERLRELQKPSATLDDAESRLRSFDLLWATLQQGRNKVSYMMELTDKVIETTSAEGIKTIRESADNTSAEFERLLQEVSAARSALSEQLSALGGLAQELQQFESWLSEARTQLAEAKSGAEQASGAVEKKTRLDKIKAISADAASKSDTVASLEKRLKVTQQLNTPERRKMIADFAELQKEAEELASRLEKEVEALERQRSIHAQAVQWLKEAKLKLQKCADATGSQAVVREKATQLSKLRESLPAGVALVKDVAQCTEEVSPCLNQSGKERLQENLQDLRQDLEQLEHGVEDAQDALDDCLQCWERFGELYGTMSQWLSQFEGNAKAALASTAFDADHLKQLKALLEEASFHKPDMEEMNEECERLLLVSAQTSVRDQAVKLSTAYTSLVAALQENVTKLQRTLGSQEEFDKAKQKFVQWLEAAQKKLSAAKEPGTDLTTVQKHLAELKELHQSLSEGKHLFDVVTEAASKIQGLSDVGQSPIRSQVDSLRDQLTTLEQNTSEATGRLASLQSRWQELMQGADTLKASLQEVEETLKERPVSGGDLVQIRCLVEQYKVFIHLFIYTLICIFIYTWDFPQTECKWP